MKFYDMDVASFSHTHRKNVTEKMKKIKSFPTYQITKH